VKLICICAYEQRFNMTEIKSINPHLAAIIHFVDCILQVKCLSIYPSSIGGRFFIQIAKQTSISLQHNTNKKILLGIEAFSILSKSIFTAPLNKGYSKVKH